MKASLFFKGTTLIVAVSLLLFVFGCAGIQIKADNQPVLAKIAARVSGKAIGDHYPGLIDPLQKWADTLSDIELGGEGDLNSLIKKALDYVKLDAYYKQNLCDVLELFEFNVEMPAMPGWLTPERIKVIQGAMAGFKEGLEAAKPPFNLSDANILTWFEYFTTDKVSYPVIISDDGTGGWLMLF